MTREDVQKLLKVLRVAYPNSFRGLSNEETFMFLDLWAEAFKNDSAELVTMAVKSIIYTDTREFAPNIATVRQAMYKLSTPNELTDQEAWALVFKALKNGNWKAQEEFDKLPSKVQRIVGSPNMLRTWALMDTSELNTVVASHFMRSYRAYVSKSQEYDMLPNQIKAKLGTIEFIRIGSGEDDSQV